MGAAKGELDRAAPLIAARHATLGVVGLERDHAAAAVRLDLATAQEHRPQAGTAALHPRLRARDREAETFGGGLSHPLQLGEFYGPPI